MTARSFDYFVYNWLRRKGVKIRVLTANYYPLNYVITVGSRQYWLVFCELNVWNRIKVKDMRYGENIYVFVYDKRKDKYYLIPSFCVMSAITTKNELFFSGDLQKKYLFSPLETFCEHSSRKVLSTSKNLSRRVSTLNPHQQLLQEFFH